MDCASPARRGRPDIGWSIEHLHSRPLERGALGGTLRGVGPAIPPSRWRRQGSEPTSTRAHRRHPGETRAHGLDLTVEHSQTDSADRCAAGMLSGAPATLMPAGVRERDCRLPGVIRLRRAVRACACVAAHEGRPRERTENRAGHNGNEGAPYSSERQRAIAWSALEIVERRRAGQGDCVGGLDRTDAQRQGARDRGTARQSRAHLEECGQDHREGFDGQGPVHPLSCRSPPLPRLAQGIRSDRKPQGRCGPDCGDRLLGSAEKSERALLVGGRVWG